MSGYQQGQGGHHNYDDGYGHGNTDSYYQDDQHYYDNNGHGRGGYQQGDGYYDESYVSPSPQNFTGV